MDIFDETDCEGVCNFMNDDETYEVREYTYGPIAIKSQTLGKHLQHCSFATARLVWKGAEELCRYMADHEDFFRNMRVLELGSGCGLCGICAAKLGARCSILTDMNEEILSFTQSNVNLNSLNDCRCVPLLWGVNNMANFIAEFGRNSFDVVIASDVVYDLTSMGAMAETIKTVLHVQGVLIMCNKINRIKRISFGDVADTLYAHCADIGLVLVESFEPRWPGFDPSDALRLDVFRFADHQQASSS